MLCFEVFAPLICFYSCIVMKVSPNTFHGCTWCVWWYSSSIIWYDPFEYGWLQLKLKTVSWKVTTLCFAPSRKTCTQIESNLQTLQPMETLCWVCTSAHVWFVYLLCAQVRDRRHEYSSLSVYVCWYCSSKLPVHLVLYWLARLALVIIWDSLDWMLT